MKIAVIGAGPAGSRAARFIAAHGHEVRLYDPRSPWEKPCGGGVTARAVSIAGVIPAGLARQEIDRVSLSYGDACSVVLDPVEPLIVVSRKELADHLLKEAIAGGVTFVPDRVVALERCAEGWSVGTRDDTWGADVLIGADGTSSLVRRTVAAPFSAEDLCVTQGYFIPAETDTTMRIFFVPALEGYLWSFPRRTHLSYGLIARPGPHWTSRGRALLENYIVADLGREALAHATFYSASVPALRPEAWPGNPLAGNAWALVGDAAGLADPITGEGICHALRSAEILGDCFPDLEAYRSALRQACVADLERAARLYPMFYKGRFLGGSFLKRAVQLTRRSSTLRRHLGDLIAGKQPYRGLRRRLLKSAPRVVWDLVRSEGIADPQHVEPDGRAA